MTDILKAMREAGFEPEVNQDSSGFEMINGSYVARIEEAGRKAGKSAKSGNDYDFRTIKLQVVEVIKGDKAMNRYLDMTYNLDEKGMKRLIGDLFTAGIECNATNDAELDELLTTLKDKTMNIRCWVWTPTKDREGNALAEEDRKSYQQIKVVKELKGAGKSGATSSNVPF